MYETVRIYHHDKLGIGKLEKNVSVDSTCWSYWSMKLAFSSYGGIGNSGWLSFDPDWGRRSGKHLRSVAKTIRIIKISLFPASAAMTHKC